MDQGHEVAALPYTRAELKKRAYGDDRPSPEIMMRFAIEETKRVSADLARLEAQFPSGFGCFKRMLEGW